MVVNVYDVGHGFCGYVRDGITGANLLIDCGFNEETGFHPSDEALRWGAIDRLVIQNCDEDHLDGLPHLIGTAGRTPVGALFGNPSLDSRSLLSMKEPPYGMGLRALVQLKSVYTWPLAPGRGQPGEMSISHYWNEYPSFDDTNNLSLVTFVHGPEYSVIFPGDLECAGWRTLLTNADFRRELSRVGVFIASHHGRENGYCEEVFDYCRPQVVIISDEPMQYDTQEHCYTQHASGISWNGGREIRRVLTTRCDGDIRIGPGLLIQTSAA
jgi:beta-lactamase superfamily II metal-dependent hydrolase